jgi:MFS family permease
MTELERMSSHESHRTRTLWMIGALHAFTHLYGVALLPLYLLIKADLNLGSIEQATLLVTAMGLAYFVPSYPMGVLADRFSRKKLLALGLVVNALGFVGLSMARSYGGALACVIVAGLGGSFYHPAATALIARLFPEARGRALGMVGIGASVGFFISPLYCGWRAVAAGSWRTPAAELGVLGLVAAGLFLWLADDERRRPSTEPAPHAPAGKLFATPTLWLLFLAAALLLSIRDFAGSAMATSASLFLQNAKGFSPKTAGIALSGFFIASMISNPLFGRLSDKGRIRWLFLLLVTAAALISVFPHVGRAWMTPVLLAYGFFFMASYPVTEAAVMEAVHDSVRGRVFGLFITVGGLVGNLSHWVTGDWIHGLGSRAATASAYYPFYTGLAILLLLSLSALPFLHAIRRREHPATAPGAPPLSALH